MPELMISQETTNYLTRLAPYLGHLPLDEQADLLEELLIHLESVRDVADASGDPTTLTGLVGEPEDFVAEYCRSAGIPLVGDQPTQARPAEPRPNVDGPVTRTLNRALGAVSSISDRVSARENWSSFLGFLPELAPAWWVLRAVLLTMVLGEIFGGDGATNIGAIPVPKLFGSAMFGTVFAAWLATKSVAFGRRENKRTWMTLASMGAAGLCFIAFGTIAFASAAPNVVYLDSPQHHVDFQIAPTPAPVAPQVRDVPDNLESLDHGGVQRFMLDTPYGSYVIEGEVFDPFGHPIPLYEVPFTVLD